MWVSAMSSETLFSHLPELTEQLGAERVQALVDRVEACGIEQGAALMPASSPGVCVIVTGHCVTCLAGSMAGGSPRSLSDLSLIGCASGKSGPFLPDFPLHGSTMHL